MAIGREGGGKSFSSQSSPRDSNRIFNSGGRGQLTMVQQQLEDNTKPSIVLNSLTVNSVDLEKQIAGFKWSYNRIFVKYCDWKIINFCWSLSQMFFIQVALAYISNCNIITGQGCVNKGWLN